MQHYYAPERTNIVEKITANKPRAIQIANFVRNRRSILLREITDLEEALVQKKAELESLNNIQFEK